MKKINNIIYSNSKQAVLPMLIQDYLDICEPVLTFDRFMGEIELEKYLKNIPQHYTGRLRYDPVSMLKTATEKSRYRLFGKITTLFEEINEELSCTGMKLCINSEYVM